MQKSIVSVLLAIHLACALGDPLIGSLPSLPTYSTSFPATETPISEGGRWSNGGVVALDWNNVNTTGGSPGKAYCAVITTTYDDCIAILSGFPANQSAQGTIYLDPTYTAPSTHEIELHLRSQLSAHNARGYEVDLWFAGGAIQIVRWNGAPSDFTILSISGPGLSSLVTGDIVKATMIGNVITVYKNGSMIATATDNTFTNGNPGMGFYVQTGGTPDKYCLSQFTAAGIP